MTDQTYLGTAYAAKDASYFGGARADYVSRLPSDSKARILELGCGDGATVALALQQEKCCEYVGIEMFRPMAEIAADRISKVHVGNVDEVDLPYDANYFDALIMSEVLEHLIDPETTLKRLVRLVRPGGMIFASSPNIAHWRIIRSLIDGKFEYTESGAMDRTHLKWFTPSSYARMFRNSGVAVEYVGPISPLKGRQRIFAKFLTSKFEHMIYYQINLIGRIK